MASDEIAALALRLRLDAGNAALGLAVAARLDALAEECAALENLPIPADLRKPERQPGR